MIFNDMLSLNDAPNYSTWFYLWQTQGGATQRGTPGYNGIPGYCIVHHILDAATSISLSLLYRNKFWSLDLNRHCANCCMPSRTTWRCMQICHQVIISCLNHQHFISNHILSYLPSFSVMRILSFTPFLPAKNKNQIKCTWAFMSFMSFCQEHNKVIRPHDFPSWCFAFSQGPVSQRVVINRKFSKYTICHWATTDIKRMINRNPLCDGTQVLQHWYLPSFSIFSHLLLPLFSFPSQGAQLYCSF